MTEVVQRAQPAFSLSSLSPSQSLPPAPFSRPDFDTHVISNSHAQSHVSSENTAPLDIPALASNSRMQDPVRIANTVTSNTFSPVNQNGSYECDRVLKSGYVEKRTRKTKTWKRIYLVLRANLLSIYKDDKEQKLRHQITLSDLTAVAYLKDPKHRRENVFGLFSRSRNWHLQAPSVQHCQEWVELIRRHARIEEEEEEMFLASPGGHARNNYVGFKKQIQSTRGVEQEHHDRVFTSSPEPIDPFLTRRLSRSSKVSTGLTQRSTTFEYSGNELASHSDMSDVDPTFSHPHTFTPGSIPISGRNASTVSVAIPEDRAIPDQVSHAVQPTFGGRDASQVSNIQNPPTASTDLDTERIVWQGHLLFLRSKRGVRAWRPLWAVVRPRAMALYKDSSEYAPRLIIPFAVGGGLGAISAVEIDGISRTKQHCFMVITEEKNFRFCVKDEDELNRVLGGLKSVLIRGKDSGKVG